MHKTAMLTLALESVIAFPALGIQFETHRGFPPYSFSVARTFVSLAELDDVILNEALYGWNVRYYMAALHHSAAGGSYLRVAFEVRNGCQNIIEESRF